MAVTTRAVMVNDDAELVNPVAADFLEANGLTGVLKTVLPNVIAPDVSWPGSLTSYSIAVPFPPVLSPTNSWGLKKIRISALNAIGAGGGTITAKIKLTSSVTNFSSFVDFTMSGTAGVGGIPSVTDGDDLDADFFEFADNQAWTPGILSLQYSGGTAPKGVVLTFEWIPWEVVA